MEYCPKISNTSISPNDKFLIHGGEAPHLTKPLISMAGIVDVEMIDGRDD
jgi:hypothetical protein